MSFCPFRVGAVKDFLLSHHPAVEQGTNITHHEKSINGSFEVINVGGNFNEVMTHCVV